MSEKDVVGFDDYISDFEEIALPEYHNLAEKLLLDALETCEAEEMLQVELEEALCRDKCSHVFLFDATLGGNAENGGVIISYMEFA